MRLIDLGMTRLLWAVGGGLHAGQHGARVVPPLDAECQLRRSSAGGRSWTTKLRVSAMVKVAHWFDETRRVANGYSDLINEVYGRDAGAHARSSIEMMISLNAPVNCEAEVDIDGA